jgi:hypothetical protein
METTICDTRCKCKIAIGLHKLVAIIFAVSFDIIIIPLAVDNESCYPMKNTLIILIITVLPNFPVNF